MSAPQSQCPEYINEHFIEQILQSGFNLSEVRIRDFSVTPLTGGGGENYCSDIYEVNIEYQSPRTGEREEKLILKSIPEHKQTALKRMTIYSREQYFYEHLMPQLEALMGVTDENWVLGPRLVYATSRPVETVVLQHLTPLGFHIKSRQDGLDEQHATLALAKLAQFHASTFALTNDEKKCSDIMQRYPFGLVNVDSCKSESFKALFGSQLMKLISILQGDEKFVNAVQKLRKYHENFSDEVLKCITPLRGQLNVLNHGDIWVNNMLFRYGPDKAVPLEVRFIDFQLSFYGSLGFDVNYFLNTSIQQDVLNTHRQTLIDSYVDTFLKTLHHMAHTGHQPTREQVAEEINQKERYGFFVAFAFLPLMCMEHQDSQDNSLENLRDAKFAARKIDLMFSSNPRTIIALKYAVRRLVNLDLL